MSYKFKRNKFDCLVNIIIFQLFYSLITFIININTTSIKDYKWVIYNFYRDISVLNISMN